jgi:hypothetical protein
MAVPSWPAPLLRASRLLAGLAGVALAATIAGPTRAADTGRVVAVGDIHGALDNFKAILQAAGLTDARQRWTGGRSTLVQTGDFSDRGADVRGVMDLLMALEREAPRHGGQVVTLLGNHEVMVLMGDFRDVTPEICATFADARSEARRERAWRDQSGLAAREAGRFDPPPPVYAQTREEFMAAWPPGCLEYREALRPRGSYGAWLRSKPIAAIVEGTLYMHAGASPSLDVSSVDALNQRVRDELAQFDRLTGELVRARLALSHFTFEQMVEVAVAQVQAANAAIAEARERHEPLDRGRLNVPAALAANDLMTVGDWWLVAPQGPLWYRGYALDDESDLDDPFTALLARLGASHMAVAHTVTGDGRIRARLGGRLFLIDTGMLTPVYRGQPSALERGPRGGFAAIYLNERATLVASPDDRQ